MMETRWQRKEQLARTQKKLGQIYQDILRVCEADNPLPGEAYIPLDDALEDVRRAGGAIAEALAELDGPLTPGEAARFESDMESARQRLQLIAERYAVSAFDVHVAHEGEATTTTPIVGIRATLDGGQQYV